MLIVHFICLLLEPFLDYSYAYDEEHYLVASTHL